MTNRRILWPTLLIVSVLPRLLGAFFLPNAFGDAYVYIRDIGTLSTRMANGSFHVTDLFGFWLPLYQLISALLNIIVRNGFYSGKIVSALFGAGSCILVYAITLRLTRDRRAALATFLLVALNPLHIFYSASAMTDVPHAFFVLASLYFLITGNWIAAAIVGALAGMTRVESWMLIPLIPVLQFIRVRRVSFIGIAILILPPLFWFYISWKATGDALACFKQRQQYHDWLLLMNPAIARFSLRNMASDLATLLVSTDIAVLGACLFAAFLIVRSAFAHPRKVFESSHPGVRPKLDLSEPQSILAPLSFFLAFLTLLLGAYITHQQPIIFPRYGLILFSLGLPILGWTYLWIREHKPQLARSVLVAIVLICSLDASIQLAGAVGEIKRYRTQRVVADYLRDHFDQHSNAKIFCDEGTVRVLSGIPEEKFLFSIDATGTREKFWATLRDNNVTYLVAATNQENNLSPTADDLLNKDGVMTLVLVSRTNFLPTNISIYRLSWHP
jgi:hypothetical protein